MTHSDKEYFDENLTKFVVKESDRPILFEVFTKKDKDARILIDYYDECRKVLLAYKVIDV